MASSPNEADLCRRRLDLGLGVEVCWPYRPQEKGSLENLVGWVKGSFFKQRRFLDRSDLEQQLREWLTETNTDQQPHCLTRNGRHEAVTVRRHTLSALR